MKEILTAIKRSKYYKLISGTIFACLAIPFVVWGIHIMLQNKETYLEIIIPLTGILACLLLGIYFMLQTDSIPKTAS